MATRPIRTSARWTMSTKAATQTHRMGARGTMSTGMATRIPRTGTRATMSLGMATRIPRTSAMGTCIDCIVVPAPRRDLGSPALITTAHIRQGISITIHACTATTVMAIITATIMDTALTTKF